jgi:hypothetical protein
VTDGVTDPIDAELPGTERDGYVFPDYGGHCFARVPGTAAAALGADVGPSLPDGTLPDGDFERVVVLLVDGFGWDRFVDYRDGVPLLGSLDAGGRTTPITSVYPSETAAAITSLHTGRTPAEHGLLGWNLYLPEHDLTCETLPFRTRSVDDGWWHDGEQDDPGASVSGDDSAASTDCVDVAEATDGAVGGRDLFDGESVYERLAAAGVASHAVQPNSVEGGAYGEASMAGATTHGVGTVAEFALELRRQLTAADAPTYLYAYWPKVDGASHREGTTGDPYDAELAAVCHAVERELARVDPSVAAETLVVLTADHGHVNTPAADAVDVTGLPGVTEHLATHDDGRPIPPTGGPRNLHLHLDPDGVGQVRRTIDDADFAARVLTGREAIDSGLFGTGGVSPKLRERIGDLVVVPREVGAWFDGEVRKLAFVGNHGGQHPHEMYVPFVATSLADWQAER